MYGMPPDYVLEELVIQGKVISKQTGAPVPGIAVLFKDIYSYPVLTDSYGLFIVYIHDKQDNYTVIFTDIDNTGNGGNFKQKIISLTAEECEALNDENRLIIELDEIEIA
jgi:hypothetical protein